MMVAIPVTTTRFGPSGSLKSANIIPENTRAVIARISNEPVLKLRCMRCGLRYRPAASIRLRLALMSQRPRLEDVSPFRAPRRLVTSALASGHQFTLRTSISHAELQFHLAAAGAWLRNHAGVRQRAGTA